MIGEWNLEICPGALTILVKTRIDESSTLSHVYTKAIKAFLPVVDSALPQ